MLPHLYANATVFAFPVLIEGSGLPVLEVISVGLPVVTSDADAVQETAGGDALIVAARSTAHWIRAFDQILSDRDFAKGRRQTWRSPWRVMVPRWPLARRRGHTEYLHATRAGAWSRPPPTWYCCCAENPVHHLTVDDRHAVVEPLSVPGCPAADLSAETRTGRSTPDNPCVTARVTE